MKRPSALYSAILWITGIVLLCISGCKKFVEVSPPKNQLIAPAVFADDNTANSAVAGMYSYMYQLNNAVSTFGGLHLTIFPGLSADELYPPNTLQDPYYINAIPTNDGDVDMIWQSCYTIIYNANSIIEGIGQSDQMTVKMKTQLLGEALFIRAFCHFYLVNTFGDVPIVTTTEVSKTSNLPRSSVELVYQQIITDLLQARENLADDYSFSNGERVRANKWVVTAFLARVYLYRGDWMNAEIESASVISRNELYALSTDLNEVFLQNSQEAILQLLSYGGRGFTTMGILLNPGSFTSVPDYAFTDFQMNAFEPNDQRKEKWTVGYSVNGQFFQVPYKYKQTPSSGGPGEYDMVMRLAEQYLIRAESRIYLDKLDDALTDLNTIRNRAGLPDYVVSFKDSLLLAVEHERQTELFVEWGHRWMDLKRTGRAGAVLGVEKPDWNSDAALYPIPQVELSKNPTLKQNPGY